MQRELPMVTLLWAQVLQMGTTITLLPLLPLAELAQVRRLVSIGAINQD